MNKKWGLIIADPNEVHSSKLEFTKKTEENSFVFFHYKWNDVEIIVVESGIGIVNSSMMTQKLIDKHQVQKVLNYGAVGGTNRVRLFDVIIPKNFYFHDVKTPWYPRGQTPGEKEFYSNSFLLTDNINIASGNSFISEQKNLNEIKSELEVDLFDMESCAIAQVCSKNRVGFFSVKGVSDIINTTNATNKEEINQNISTASKKAFDKLISLLNEIDITKQY
ncbi:MAG: 5'-methylthioadenosine nucleosidase [Metamycoplasmataceae bacterium]